MSFELEPKWLEPKWLLVIHMYTDNYTHIYTYIHIYICMQATTAIEGKHNLRPAVQLQVCDLFWGGTVLCTGLSRYSMSVAQTSQQDTIPRP